MVRNLVGALLVIGQGKAEPKDIEKVFKTGKNVLNFVTAPSNGLYLKEIMY